MSSLLSLLLFITGVSIKWVAPECRNPDLMGYFKTGTQTITICEENAERRRESVDTIVKHEYVHFLYDIQGEGYMPIPEPLLTEMVAKRLPSGEALSVIIQENDYSSDEEFTARLIAKWPNLSFVMWALSQFPWRVRAFQPMEGL